MEDLSAYNFEVKSLVHNYKVSFVTDFLSALERCVRAGDVIIIDRKVLELYKTKVNKIIGDYKHYIVHAHEEQKSYLGVLPIIEYLVKNNFRKHNRLVAIGGGITQDATAFIASILYRGVEWMFFPTTLLSQCDSSIGSKVAINFGEYKNQIGCFYPPSHVYIDTEFLDTLSEQDIKSGLGEMLHYYIVSQNEDYEYFKQEYSRAFTNKDVMKQLLLRSLQIKKKIIEIDEFDKNERQVLNYGHSFGHALEAMTDYQVPHGIAVVYGMDMANFVSMKLEFITVNQFEEIHKFLSILYNGFDIKKIQLEKFINSLTKDKKNKGSELGLILIKGIGKIFKQYVPLDKKFHDWLEEYFVLQ
jgi:3-dehydroquinate synthase